MDRASSDCRLLYEIIGSRGCARAIQTPIPATNSGSNREREIEEREARADIAAAICSHAHHTERARVQNQTLFRETVSFLIEAFDFAIFKIIKEPQRNNEMRNEMERNANASPFILPLGTFLAVGIPVPTALRLRENEGISI
ncbi:hypothetical protein G5I_11960 [Acromyrmex echinatior]|uniref:Uncharacterized protein n=1 Tax=Acromyrmex echinatior TaxID=103372 RepID=F4X105_ACREC|nr:hypothetical protein G5I_11960 [Acromyrmex echinatior]